MSVRRSDLFSSWVRTFSVQGSWNYRSLTGGGLAYALLPILRRVYAGDPVGMRRALERHLTPFNAHPYLTPMAVGALGRAEDEGVDRERIERLRTALSGPLGTLGDRAVWAGWRPLCALLALALHLLGVGPWKAVLVFLGLYNLGHLWLRAWSFYRGWQDGLEVGRTLRGSVLSRTDRVLGPANAGLLGAGTVGVAAVVAAGPGSLPVAGGALAVALAGYGWPVAARRAAPLLVLAAAVSWAVFR